MNRQLLRSLVVTAAIVGSAAYVAVSHRASAQPVPPPNGSGSGANTGSNAGSADDKFYNCKTGVTKVDVNFKPEMDVKDLIAWAMGFSCKNFMYDPRIVATGKKVTIIASKSMSPQEAYETFLVALSTAGLTVVPKGGGVFRIVESATAKSETVPIMRRGTPANEDQVVRYILRPSFVQTETLRAALDQVRSPAGAVTAAGSLIVITDYASQIRDMMTLARAIDVPGNNEGIYTIPVLHADANQLMTKLNEILGLQAGGAGAPAGGGAPRPGRPPVAGQPPPPAGGVATNASTTADESGIPSKILVDDRTNTLIVVSSEAGYLRVKALVERLDIALDTEGGASIHVYPLDNALAEELAQTLNNALGQGAANQAGRKPGQPGAPGTPGTPPPAPSPTTPPVAPGAEGNLGASLEGQVRVIGDKSTNSLVVMSSGRDYLAVKDVIKRLDLPRRQVFIEAMILEVQIGNETDIGTSSHAGYPTSNGSLLLGGVQTPNLQSLNLTSLVSATGLIGGLIGAPLTNSQTFLGTSIPSYGILFQALATQANTNILSTPHIIAVNNEKAEFSVGNNIPYKSGLSFGVIGLPGGTAGATGGALPTGSIGQNIQRQKLDLVLNVTPHISSDDIVRLEIEQETQDIGDKDPELGPTWTERKLKTQAIVHDQQSVVIGGLIQEHDIYNVTKVPLLGDIPILGYLFKYSTKGKKRTNILILLTPYIIKDQLDLQQIRERKMRERSEFVQSFTSLSEGKYDPKIDYRRKRGVIEEINRSVLAVESDLDILNQMSKRARVIEGPIDYKPGDDDDEKKPTPTPPPKGNK